MLPNVAVLDLCLIPRLGNTLVSFLHAQLQRGLEWRLSGLLFAYSGLTREGLSELEALLRILSNRLKYMVVSGARLLSKMFDHVTGWCKHCCNYQCTDLLYLRTFRERARSGR